LDGCAGLLPAVARGRAAAKRVSDNLPNATWRSSRRRPVAFRNPSRLASPGSSFARLPGSAMCCDTITTGRCRRCSGRRASGILSRWRPPSSASAGRRRPKAKRPVFRPAVRVSV